MSTPSHDHDDPQNDLPALHLLKSDLLHLPTHDKDINEILISNAYACLNDPKNGIILGMQFAIHDLEEQVKQLQVEVDDLDIDLRKMRGDMM